MLRLKLGSILLSYFKHLQVFSAYLCCLHIGKKETYPKVFMSKIYQLFDDKLFSLKHEIANSETVLMLQKSGQN